MEFNKTVSNPMLIGAMELVKAEPTPEHRQMVSKELVKAHYLIPATVTPAPEKNEAGELHFVQGQQHQVQFPMLSAPDGKKFFMAFTDEGEFRKWNGAEKHYSFSMTFDDYAGLLLRKDSQGKQSPGAGFVVNPYGVNLIVPKEMVARYIVDKMNFEEAQKQKSDTPQN